MLRSVISGIGHYLPKNIVTNKDLEAKLDTSDEWIRERTGIEQRHIAEDGEFTSHLATKAAKAALEDAGINADEIGAIIVATTTPDESFPATAVRVQAALEAPALIAFDMQAACSGFIYAMTVADGLIKAGQIKKALVIGAETYSRLVDWNDRGTCILFGDGAGAVVLSAEENSERGLLHSTLSADGKLADILKTTGGISTSQTAGVVTMQGREVFRHAVAKMISAVEESLKATGLTLDDVDWLIPHQANARILTTIADKLSLPREKLVMTTAIHANTSAATIPLALSVAKADGRLQAGNLIALPALGAGLTWGNCLVKL